MSGAAAAEMGLTRERVASEFQATWRAEGETPDPVEGESQEIARQGREAAECLPQVEGRMLLVQRRAGKFLEGVDEDLARWDGGVGDR